MNPTNCENCAAWLPRPDNVIGECHRFAPTNRPADDAAGLVMWPLTINDDFCFDGLPNGQ